MKIFTWVIFCTVMATWTISFAEELMPELSYSLESNKEISVQFNKDDILTCIWVPINAESGFFMSKYEVTTGQYARFVNSGYLEKKFWNSEWYPENDNAPLLWDRIVSDPQLPVRYINYYQAKAFCLWLSDETGLKFRLPTESEWEIAAGKQHGFLFPWGDFGIVGIADQEDFLACNSGLLSGNRASIGGDFPHDCSWRGIYDMAGNVQEWAVNEDGLPVAKGGFYAVLKANRVEPYTEVSGFFFLVDHTNTINPQFERSISGIRLVVELPE